MFCEKCGVQITDPNASVCPACGAPLNAAPEAPAAEQPVYAEQPAYEEQPVYVEQPTPVPAPAPKKTFNLFKVIIPVVAVVLVACISFAAFGAEITNAAKQLIMSPTDYYADIEFAGVDELLDAINYEEPEYDNFALDSNVTLELSDDAKALLKDMGVDLSQIMTGGKLALDANLNGNADAVKLALAIALNDTELISADLLYDDAKQALYGKVPLIGEDSFVLADDVYADMSDADAETMNTVFDTVLPSLLEDDKLTDELKQTLKSYIKFMLENSFEFEKSTDKVTVGDVNASYTKLSADISEKSTADMLVATLEKLSKDEAAKKLIIEELMYNKIILPLKDTVSDFADAKLEEGYEGLDEAIAEAIEELKKLDDETVVATYSVWVDSKGKIVGREIEAKQEAVFRYLSASANGESAFELTAVDLTSDKQAFSITGSAEQSRGVIENGSYTLSVEGKDAIIVKVQKLDLTKSKAGEVSGKLRIELGDELFDEIMSEAGGAATLIADPAIEIEFNSTKESESVKLDALVGDKLLVTLTCNAEIGKGEAVTAPADAVDINQYLGGIEDIEGVINTLCDRLEQAGIKSEVVDMLLMSFFGTTY